MRPMAVWAQPERWWRLAQQIQWRTMSASVTAWEYATVPLLTHATKQILDQWGADGWELVTVLPGPTGEQLVAYLKRPASSGGPG